MPLAAAKVVSAIIATSKSTVGGNPYKAGLNDAKASFTVSIKRASLHCRPQVEESLLAAGRTVLQSRLCGYA
jgi:hypothetical protein